MCVIIPGLLYVQYNGRKSPFTYNYYSMESRTSRIETTNRIIENHQFYCKKSLVFIIKEKRRNANALFNCLTKIHHTCIRVVIDSQSIHCSKEKSNVSTQMISPAHER